MNTLYQVRRHRTVADATPRFVSQSPVYLISDPTNVQFHLEGVPLLRALIDRGDLSFHLLLRKTPAWPKVTRTCFEEQSIIGSHK